MRIQKQKTAATEKPADLNDARVKQIIRDGAKQMETGQSAIFPISRVINAERLRKRAQAKNAKR